MRRSFSTIGHRLGRLPYRLLLFVAVPLLLSQLAIALFVHRTLEDRVESRMQEDVGLIARALQRPVSLALSGGDILHLLSVLETSFDFQRVYGAAVYGPDGKLLASSGPMTESFRKVHGDLPRKGGGQYEVSQEETIYSYYVPVSPSSQQAGVLQVARKRSEIDRFLSGLRLHTLTLLLLGTVVTIVIVFGGHYLTIGRALRAFHSSIEQVQEGNRAHRVLPQGPREVNGIMRAFNETMDSIDRANEVLFLERERKLELASRLLQAEKMASIGRIAGGIAHELGSPLGTCSGRLQRVLRREDVPNAARKEVELLVHEVEHMTRIVSEVLDFARTDRSERRLVKLRDVVDRVATTMSDESLEGKSLQIDDFAGGATIFAEPNRLERAVSNLVRNAIVAAQRQVVVRIACDTTSTVKLDIVDDGPGIARSVRETLFEPFVTTKPGRGTGLGLPIAQAIVHQHRGSIKVKSSDRGAIFSVCFPRHGGTLQGSESEGLG